MKNMVVRRINLKAFLPACLIFTGNGADYAAFGNMATGMSHIVAGILGSLVKIAKTTKILI
jgi:hypothetical protein